MRINQKGLTLIELLVAMAVGGMLLGVLVPSIFQTTRGTVLTTVEVTALNNVENAAHWINKDVRMAKETNLQEEVPLVNPTPESPLTLNWTDWTDWVQEEFRDHSCAYWLEGTDLQRNYDGTVTRVARYISDIEFSQSGTLITVTITSTPEGVPERSEKRTYRIYLRPEL